MTILTIKGSTIKGFILKVNSYEISKTVSYSVPHIYLQLQAFNYFYREVNLRCLVVVDPPLITLSLLMTLNKLIFCRSLKYKIISLKTDARLELVGKTCLFTRNPLRQLLQLYNVIRRGNYTQPRQHSSTLSEKMKNAAKKAVNYLQNVSEKKRRIQQSSSTKHHLRHWLKKKSMKKIIFSVHQCLEKGKKKNWC